MKLHHAPRRVNPSNDTTGETRQFSIDPGAKAFHLLLDKVYTNKPMAVIREAVQNAYDAHLSADPPVEKPFIVICPVAGNSKLVIQDFGDSMDHEFMMDGYCRVTHTTKEDSPSSVGGLGIGRLSMLAVCDTYSITTVRDNVKRIYTIFLNDQRIPSIMCAGEYPTAKPGGTTVEIPIESMQCKRFAAEAAQVMRFFPEGSYTAHNFQVFPVEYKLRAGIVGIRKAASRSSFVIMGPMAYELTTHLVPEFSSTYKVLGSLASFDLFLPINGVDVAPSRERLDYSKHTLRMLMRYGAEAEAQLQQHFKERIALGTTEIQRAIYARELYDANLMTYTVYLPYLEKARIRMTGVRWGTHINEVRLNWHSEFNPSIVSLSGTPEQPMWLEHVTFVRFPSMGAKISAFQLCKGLQVAADSMAAKPSRVYVMVTGTSDPQWKTIVRNVEPAECIDFVTAVKRVEAHDTSFLDRNTDSGSRSSVKNEPRIYRLPRAPNADGYNLEELKYCHLKGLDAMWVSTSRSVITHLDEAWLQHKIDSIRPIGAIRGHIDLLWHDSSDAFLPTAAEKPEIIGIPVSHRKALEWAKEHLPTPEQAFKARLNEILQDHDFMYAARSLEPLERISRMRSWDMFLKTKTILLKLEKSHPKAPITELYRRFRELVPLHSHRSWVLSIKDLALTHGEARAYFRPMTDNRLLQLLENLVFLRQPLLDDLCRHNISSSEYWGGHIPAPVFMNYITRTEKQHDRL